jgi:hypothetical protein
MYTMLSDPTLTRALCCDCGQLRTVKRRYRLGRFVPELGSGYLMSPQGRSTYPFAQPWDRFVGDLKCSHCRATTRHAVVRDGDDYADHAEERERGVSR